jgi:hypothetical protein
MWNMTEGLHILYLTARLELLMHKPCCSSLSSLSPAFSSLQIDKLNATVMFLSIAMMPVGLTHGTHVLDVFDTIPLIPLQPLPRACPPH